MSYGRKNYLFMNPKFSLIICTYMRVEPLATLLESVKRQTLYPDEILIIDGSTNDETAAHYRISDLEQSTRSTLKNLRYYKVPPEDRGLTKQRNYGIARVASDIEIICFLDDDTILDDHYFKQLIGTYTIYPEALGVGGYITNEVNWFKTVPDQVFSENQFVYDGYLRTEGSRFMLRKKLGLAPDCPPGFLPSFSHGRSISFLPPSGKIYEVEQLMGGVSSFRKELFDRFSFSDYFEGYGLYEDADFTLRVSKEGSLYINTKATLTHHHDPSGRPNQYHYGKMVMRNGWYVWRTKHPKTSIKSTIKWHAISLLLTFVRLGNVITGPDRKKAATEAAGRLVGWCTLLFNKPKLQ